MTGLSTPPNAQPNPSWKGLIPCVMGGVIASAALLFLPGWSGTPLLAQSVGSAIAWVFLTVAALVGSFMAFAMPVIGFVGVATCLSFACGLVKYRRAPDQFLDKLVFGLLLGVALVLCAATGFLDSQTSRIHAFVDQGPVSETVAAFDAMSVEELSKADRLAMSWRHQKFSRWMKNGVVSEEFTAPTCRKIIQGYLRSPAASVYDMEVNGQEVNAGTSLPACPLLEFSTIKLTKLN